MRWKTVTALAALACAAACVAFVRARGSDDQELDESRIVRVERRDLVRAVNATGRIEPKARVAVMSRTSGILNAIHVEEGDRVESGQVLAELDREQLEAQLAQEEARVAVAQAAVRAWEARIGEANLKLLDPEPEFAAREFERQEKLRAEDVSSERDQDQARERLAQAQHRLRLIEAAIPVLQAELESARSALLSVEAARARARTALRETTILSPMNGIVLSRPREVGDGVSSIDSAGGNATLILLLGDLSRIYVEAQVDEADMGLMRGNMPVLVTVDAFRRELFEGRIERIAPAGRVDTNAIVTYEVRVALEDPQGLLRPDLTANVRFVLERNPTALTLPQRALRRDSGGCRIERVLTLDPPRTELVTVELGMSDGLQAEVLGLAEGQPVVLPDG